MRMGDEGRAVHITEDELARFRTGELTPQRALEIGRHLATCALCTTTASRARELQQSMRDLQLELDRAAGGEVDGEEHPDLNRELVRYVDGTLPAGRRDTIAQHLVSCVRCREDVEDLRDVQARIEPMPVSNRTPFAIAAAAAVMVVAITALAILLRARAPHLQPPTLRQRAAAIHPTAVFRIDYGRADWNEAVRNALTNGRLEIATPELPSNQGDTLRGSAAGPAHVQLEPNNTVVDEGRPRFRWPAAEGSRYSVAVVKGDREVAHSGPLRSAEWVPAKDLPRGVILGWQVSVETDHEVTILPTPPDAPAQFRITSASDHASLSEARQKFADDHILLAVLYARSGMREAATTELQLSDKPEAARLLESTADDERLQVKMKN
jgi:anti-sigma factor RsiW